MVATAVTPVPTPSSPRTEPLEGGAQLPITATTVVGTSFTVPRSRTKDLRNSGFSNSQEGTADQTEAAPVLRSQPIRGPFKLSTPATLGQPGGENEYSTNHSHAGPLPPCNSHDVDDSTGFCPVGAKPRLHHQPSNPESPQVSELRPHTAPPCRNPSRQRLETLERGQPAIVTSVDTPQPLIKRPTATNSLPPAFPTNELIPFRGPLNTEALYALSNQGTTLPPTPEELARLEPPIGHLHSATRSVAVVPGRRLSSSRFFGWPRRPSSPAQNALETGGSSESSGLPAPPKPKPTRPKSSFPPLPDAEHTATANTGPHSTPSYQRSQTNLSGKQSTDESSHTGAIKGLIPRAARGWKVPGPSNLAALLGGGDVHGVSMDLARPSEHPPLLPPPLPPVSQASSSPGEQRKVVLKEGRLEKWTGHVGRWKERRFVVHPGTLTYYKDERTSVAIPLRGCQVKVPKDMYQFTLVPATRKEYLLKAYSGEDRGQWLRAIGKGKQLLTDGRDSSFLEQRMAMAAGLAPDDVGIYCADDQLLESDTEPNPIDRLLERCKAFKKDTQMETGEIKRLQTRLVMQAGLSKDPQITQNIREVVNLLLAQIDNLTQRVETHIVATERLIEQEASERKSIQRGMKKALRDVYRKETQLERLLSGKSLLTQHRTASGQFPQLMAANACTSPGTVRHENPVPLQGSFVNAPLPPDLPASGVAEGLKEDHSRSIPQNAAPSSARQTSMAPAASRERLSIVKDPTSQDEFFDVQEQEHSETQPESIRSSTTDESEDDEDELLSHSASIPAPVIVGLAAAAETTHDASEDVTRDTELGLARPKAWQGRTTLAMPRTNFKISLWNLLKDCVGKDLSRIALPVYFNEPTSFLQRLAEDYQYSYLLEKAALCESAMERMLYVTVYTSSPFASAVGRTYKPFNPLLGETYEITHRGFKFVAEQVGHHPPTTAFNARGAAFEAFGHLVVNTKFTGKSLEIQLVGPCNIILKLKDGSEEYYSFQRARMVVNNIIFGKISVDVAGTYVITNHTTGDVGVIDYPRRGWWSSDVHPVRGAVISQEDQTLHYTFEGIWSQQIAAMKLDPIQSQCVPGVAPRKRRVSDDPRIRFESSDFDGKLDWSVGSMMPADDSKPFVVWRVEPRPHHAPEYYEFGQMTMELNEIGSLYSTHLPPTDSRLRPDQRALEEGDVDLSNGEKLKLEEKQRVAMRKLPRGERDWVPRWFTRTTDAVLQEDAWQFDEEYWELKEKPPEAAEKIYSERCPVIF